MLNEQDGHVRVGITVVSRHPLGREELIEQDDGRQVRLDGVRLLPGRPERQLETRRVEG
jgi:hypothetical protein